MTTKHLTRSIAAASALVITAAIPALATQDRGLPHVTENSPTGVYAEGVSLVNGRLVNPAGRRTQLGDFPVDIAISPDGRTAVIPNSGQGEGGNPLQGNESLEVVDIHSGKVIQVVTDHAKGKDTFYNAGVAFSKDGSHVYATGGGNNAVYDYAVAKQHLTLQHTWKSSLKAGAPTIAGNHFGQGVPSTVPMLADVGAYSRGLALSSDGKAVIVGNEEGSSVAAISTTTGRVMWETQLAGSFVAGAYPESITVVGSKALVPAMGLNALAVLDTTTGAILGLAPVGDHPISVAVDGDQAWVANANDDSVSVVDLSATPIHQVAQYATHLIDGEADGSTPAAIAFDGDRVFIALSGDNAVLVMDHKGHVLGAVPTGWYPTALAVRDHTLLAVAAKGLGSLPVTTRKEYDGNDMTGLLTQISTRTKLAKLTAEAKADLLFPSTHNVRPADSPIPDAAHAGQSPIKHVVFIVRENRTFDQIFGDLKTKGADVDKQYVEFGDDQNGRSITPNAHAIASRFGISQNFYSDGEASQQGHFWTAEGISTDFDEKSWLYSYSSRNRPYDQVAPVIHARCGALWQHLTSQGKSFRNFGEFVGVSTTQTPTVNSGPGTSCPLPGGVYDPESVAGFSPGDGGNLTLTAVPDTTKEQEFEREFGPLIAAGQMPQFTYVVMGNDHTDGTSAGKPTPQAHIATNDLGVGKLIDYLSHSSIWPSTAVFAMEDDSQDGLDHRDGHRNVLLVASPYSKPGTISSTHISQASILRTMELILGVSPISSYTQFAAVPYDLFQSKPDLSPYVAVQPTYPLNATNKAARAGTASALKIDLSDIDRAGPLLEAQIWEATHPGVGMPVQLLEELKERAGISQQALDAWSLGEPCRCNPRTPGIDD